MWIAVLCWHLLAVGVKIECLIVWKRMDDVTLKCLNNTVLPPAFCTERMVTVLCGGRY